MDQTLRYLLLIRLVVIGGQCLALGLMDGVFGVDVPWLAVSAVLGLFALFTVVTWRRYGHGHDQPGQRHYLAQTIADIVALSALIHFTGGAFNPFTSLFLLPIVFAAAAMPAAHLAGVTLLTGACYTTLMLIEPRASHLHAGGGFDLHVWGMWYGFGLSAICVALFVARLSRAMRQRDRELAELREAALESERVLALGTLAAGTAHELGTPLATIAVLAGELDETLNDGASRAQLARLRAQIARCKDILTGMSSAAGNLKAGDGRRTDVKSYLDGIVADWRARRPEVSVRVDIDGARPAPAIVADRVVTQAIVNVLDNAADAARRAVEINGHWDREALELAIRDDGTGIAPEIRARVGHEALTTKRDGMGIGLLLSRSIIERLGGVLEFDAHPEQGTQASIRLPLGALAAR